MRSRQKNEDATRFENNPSNRDTNEHFQECAGFGCFWSDFCCFKNLKNWDWEEEQPKDFMILSEEFRLIYHHCYSPKNLSVGTCFLLMLEILHFLFFVGEKVTHVEDD